MRLALPVALACIVVLSVNARSNAAEHAPALDEDAVVARQQQWVAELKALESTRAKEPGDKAALARLIDDLREHRELYAAHPDGHGLALWCSYMLGRAYALGGNQEASYREFDRVTGERPERYAGASRQFIDDLRMRAYRTKAAIALQAGEYEKCVHTVDALIAPVTGYPGDMRSALGAESRAMKAEALMKLGGPRMENAAVECMAIVSLGFKPWADRASRMMHTIVAASMQSTNNHRMMLPSRLSVAGDGARLKAEEAETDAEHLRRMFEAIDLYSMSMSREDEELFPFRKDIYSFWEEIRFAPRALFGMGLCWSKLKCWHEAALCFEGVLIHYSRREVAALGIHRSAAGDVLVLMQRDAPDLKGDAMLDGFYARLSESQTHGNIFRRHTGLLNLCAKNMEASYRNQWRESGLDFDRQLVSRARAIAEEAGLDEANADSVAPLDDTPVF